MESHLIGFVHYNTVASLGKITSAGTVYQDINNLLSLKFFSGQSDETMPGDILIRLIGLISSFCPFLYSEH